MESPNDHSVDSTLKFKNVSPLSHLNNPTPQKPYNINQNYFLHIDQTVPFDLDDVYFTAHITEDGIYFKVQKGRTPMQ